MLGATLEVGARDSSAGTFLTNLSNCREGESGTRFREQCYSERRRYGGAQAAREGGSVKLRVAAGGAPDFQAQLCTDTCHYQRYIDPKPCFLF